MRTVRELAIYKGMHDLPGRFIRKPWHLSFRIPYVGISNIPLEQGELIENSHMPKKITEYCKICLRVF